MFFKRIVDKLKQRAGHRFIIKALRNVRVYRQGKRGIRTIGCIVDLDNFPSSEGFNELVVALNINPSAVKIIGYKRTYDENSPYATPVFSDKDLGWKGAIENSYAVEFLNREYDLLINYYTEDALLLRLMSVKAKTRLRVGFRSVGSEYNDLMIEVPMSDFQLFKSELKKYLEILKEL